MSNFIFLLGILLIFSHAISARASFDYFKLVQVWPASYCTLNTCARKPNNFTTHGLWPDNFTRTSCSYNPSYTPLIDRNFISWLDRRWTNLRVASASAQNAQGLWRHEWDYHGWCSGMNQNSYFRLAGNLKDRYNILGILRQAGMYPGLNNVVSISRVNSSVAANTNHLPDVRCKYDNQNNLLLNEIVICFNPSGTIVIDCPSGTLNDFMSSSICEVPDLI